MMAAVLTMVEVSVVHQTQPHKPEGSGRTGDNPQDGRDLSFEGTYSFARESMKYSMRCSQDQLMTSHIIMHCILTLIGIVRRGGNGGIDVPAVRSGRTIAKAPVWWPEANAGTGMTLVRLGCLTVALQR